MPYKTEECHLEQAGSCQAACLTDDGPAAEVGTALYPWELGHSPTWCGPVVNTLRQGTQEEWGPPLHQVIGVQNSVPAVDHEVTGEVAPAYSAMVWEPLEVSPPNPINM